MNPRYNIVWMHVMGSSWMTGYLAFTQGPPLAPNARLTNETPICMGLRPTLTWRMPR
jgi:hypothetical protein